MRLDMAEQIKQTINCDNGIDKYTKWINLPPKECEPLGLIVSYDMGWKLRSSGRAYNIMSVHSFMIGALTN